MATPYIFTLEFKTESGNTGLQKNTNKKNSVKITGINLSEKDIVILIGSSGTIWKGRLGGVDADGSYTSKNLKCIDAEFTQAEKDASEKKDKSKRPKIVSSEDISTTVTNPTTGTSHPVQQPVPIIP